MHACRVLVRSRGLFELRRSTPLLASVFNVVGGLYVPPHQDTLMAWYVIAEPCHVSVLRIGVREPGGAKWSCRCCTSLAFGKVSICPTSCGHLALALTSHGLPRGAGVSGHLVLPWAYKYRPSFHLNHSWL